MLATSGKNFLHALMMPHLPARAQHVPLRLDVGLVVYFWFCVVAFGIIKTVSGRRTASKPHKQ